MPDQSPQHPMTADEFSVSMRGFYDLLERIAQTFEWIAEDMYRARPAADRPRPPHMPWDAE